MSTTNTCDGPTCTKSAHPGAPRLMSTRPWLEVGDELHFHSYRCLSAWADGCAESVGEPTPDAATQPETDSTAEIEETSHE